MIQGYPPVVQALFGTLFTWAVTAAGAASVFFFRSGQRKILDASLGFAAGVMTAASYWSLLAPAIELAKTSGRFGAEGEYAFFPAAVGFLLGAAFVYATDLLLPAMNIPCPSIALAMHMQPEKTKQKVHQNSTHANNSLGFVGPSGKARHRKKGDDTIDDTNCHNHKLEVNEVIKNQNVNHHLENNYKTDEKFWRRVLLLILAITVHNIPEGLAVGVGFGAVSKTSSATFEKASLTKGSPDVKVTLMTRTLTPFLGQTTQLDTSILEHKKAIIQEETWKSSAKKNEGWPDQSGNGKGTLSSLRENCRTLAIGIGLQNFPEGLAVSVPLCGAGMSPWKSFWYGQLSGLVEPIAGVCGAIAVTASEALLPYALAFAAGAMIYVVVDDIIPEPQMHGNGRLATWCTIFGFLLMMCLENGLG